MRGDGLVGLAEVTLNLVFKFGDRAEAGGLVPLQNQILRSGLREARKEKNP